MTTQEEFAKLGVEIQKLKREILREILRILRRIGRPKQTIVLGRTPPKEFYPPGEGQKPPVYPRGCCR